MSKPRARTLRLGWFCLLLVLGTSSPAVAAEESYKFNAEASLVGGCGSTSKADPIEDPGCPGGAHPPKKFSAPSAVATDKFGNEYVASYGAKEDGSEGRIDIFGPSGNFLVEVAAAGPRAVAVDSAGNLYVLSKRPGSELEVSRYLATEYEPKTEKFKYASPVIFETHPSSSGGSVAVDLSNNHVFVSYGGNFFKEFGTAAEENKLLETITHARLHSSTELAVDAKNRRLYVSSCPDGDINDCWVVVFNADDPHELIEEVTGANTPEEEFASNKGWLALAVDESDGSLFVGDLELTNRVYKFAKTGEYLSTTSIGNFESNPPQQIAVSNSPEGTPNYRFLYIPSHSTGVGHAYAYEPPGVEAPEIESLGAGSISETEAELQAQIEPSGGAATYAFEYITQQAYEEAGSSFTGATVARKGTLTGSQQEAKVTASISGLTPGTAYRFRVVVENEIDSDEKEASFSTYADAPIALGCSNQALRVGYSALLPDCRSYELVTPADTGGKIPSGANFAGDIFPTVKAAPSGSVASFLTHGGAIPGLGGSGSYNGDLYLSVRSESGWSTLSAGPTGEQTTSASQGSTSPDQGYAFWRAAKEGSAVIDGGETSYVRYPDGHSELIGRGSLGVTDPRARGRLITENGTHIVFETHILGGDQPIQLEPNAPPTGTPTVYDRIKNPAAPGGEETKVISLLPGDVTPATGENASYVGASADGEGIAFAIGSKLYLRVNNEETFEAGSGVTFAGVAEGGERIFYLEEGDLKAFDSSTEEEIAFTDVTGSVTPVNVSEDGSRAYFVFNNTIPGAGSNPEGKFAKAGQPNLFLSEAGEISFVATVTARDVEGEEVAGAGRVDGLGLWTVAVRGSLALDPSRLNPDGSVMLFQSRANLDGYDPPEDAPQVYRYSQGDDRLHCISCIPTKGPATEGASLQSYLTNGGAPPPLSASSFVPNLRADGDRVFFQSTEALVSRDNNGVQDVYEWEEVGVGGCTTVGGCVYLITSGRSVKDNYLYAHGASGDDVFFATADALVPDDDNTLSIYDAKVGGGFAVRSEGVCEGEGCRPALEPAPRFETPSTKAPSGSDAPARRLRCPKGKRKVKRAGKVVCVKKKRQKKQSKKAGKTAGKGARK